MKITKNHGILLLLLISLISVFLVYSCAGKKPAWGDEKNGFILKYNFPINQTLKYQFDQQQKTTQEMMGRSMEFNTNIYSVMFFKGTGAEKNGNLLLKAGFDTLYIKSLARGQEIKPDMSPFFGKEFDLTLSQVGEKLSFNDPESIKVNFGPMMGSRGASDFFRKPLPILPDHPVKLGESWTVVDSMNIKQSGMDILIQSNTKSTLEKMEVIDGVECFKVVSSITGTLDGSGNQMGMDIYFEGDLSGDGTYYFDFKNGKLINWGNNILMEGTVAVTGQQNMTIPMTQESTTKVKLMK